RRTRSAYHASAPSPPATLYLTLPPPPPSPLFPYTTLFRSSACWPRSRTSRRCCSCRPRCWSTASGGASGSPCGCWWAHASCTGRSEEHTSELQSRSDLVCRLLLEKTKTTGAPPTRPPSTLL